MELRHLRYFAAVARNLSFSGAAREIHVAQPAVSETVRDLESELGVELLARTRHAVKLTAAGVAFLREAERILLDATAAGHLAQRAARGELGHLAIGFPAPAAAPFLPAVIRDFRRMFPAVGISLQEVTPRELVQGMVEERFDLGFTRPLPEGRQGLLLHEETIYHDELCVALPRDHALADSTEPLPLRRLAREELILMRRSEAPWLFDAIVAACRKSGFSPRMVSTPDYMSTALVMVEAGLGVSIVPASTAAFRSHLPLVFRRIAPSIARIPLLMVWPRTGVAPMVARFSAEVLKRRQAIEELMVATT